MKPQLERVARYVSRRRRLLDEIDEGIALINSSGVSTDPLLWDKNLQYLTGLRSKQAWLLLAPRGVIVDRFETLHGPELGRGRRVQEILFVEERSAHERFMDGEGPTMAEIKEATGVDAVYGLSRMNEVVGQALMKEKVLWLNTPGVPLLEEPLKSDIARINWIRERFYWLTLKNIAPKIHDLRRIKEPYEIECLRKAFEVTTRAFEKIMRTLKPGDNESLGQAIFEYEARSGPKEVSIEMDLYAASLIVAAGKNAAIPHYMDNNQEIKDGDLVLIDNGMSYEGYSADITRVFPANGRFTKRQRELYSIVLEAQEAAIETMKPGSTVLEAHTAVYDHFKKHGLDRYSYGMCGHPIGLNIHDAGDRDMTLEPGVVLVIEPFIMIPEEGIGIRLEDGVLITKDGPEVLMGPPKRIDEVEALCCRS